MLDELQRKAEAATPGPWHAPGMAELHDESHRVIGAFSDTNPVDQEERPSPSIEEGDRNAAFVAAADPTTMLRLIAVARAAQNVRDQFFGVSIELQGQAITRLRASIAALEGGGNESGERKE